MASFRRPSASVVVTRLLVSNSLSSFTVAPIGCLVFLSVTVPLILCCAAAVTHAKTNQISSKGFTQWNTSFFFEAIVLLREYGSGTPAAMPNAEGEEIRVRLPEHFVANFYFGVDLFREGHHSISVQLNIENATDRVFQIAKESEFTPIQFSPPRFVSASLTAHF